MSTHGRMKNTPGPLAPPVRRRPSLKMTARSYSWTTWRGAEITDITQPSDWPWWWTGGIGAACRGPSGGWPWWSGASTHPDPRHTKLKWHWPLRQLNLTSTFDYRFVLHNGLFTPLNYVPHQVTLSCFMHAKCHKAQCIPGMITWPYPLIMPWFMVSDN